ncbi:sulfurtransferase TusA family protein [Calorimonas adulescens]|jgi:SirA-like protein.|uniref:Sulfurtransferase TusA family protein n=1 Tax=Calorimonas adulescens TaxID=2606906 RepID=A0A5D8QDS2_9THEO|nr:sulfurtransferase TusA family protein [Calorimonas adulescens]TZE81408.1 sulfurtransferase TusA family protein [Calorimonas adulescens]
MRYDIDCFGEMCPVPMLKLKGILKDLKDGDSIKLVTDHSCVLSSISDYLKHRRLKVEIEEVINGVWEIYIEKR